MRALLVLNERSRRGKQAGDAVCRTLGECGISCEAQDAPVDAVIAAGGDGTVIGAVPRALERGVPLGIVPLGTFNDLARTLQIPAEIDAACRTIAARRCKRIDLGIVNGVHFVNEASVGISTRAARIQTPSVKQRLGVLAVLWSAIRALTSSRPFPVEVRYDGEIENFRAVQLTIANNGRFGGVIHRPDAAIDDGWLDLYGVEVAGRLRMGLRVRRSTRFEVRTRRAHHITADGEPAGFTPAEFRILPRALDVIVP